MNHLPLKVGLALSLGLTFTLTLLLIMIHLAAGATPARAAEHTVCREGPPSCTFTTVQAAVDGAVAGDVIKVAAGVYTGVNSYGGLSQVVYISRSVTIRGGYTTTNNFAGSPDPDAYPTTLDAAGQGRVLYITGNISPTIEGLRITGGDATGLGGGPWGGADAGGGVYVATATATISNNSIVDNYGDQAGGGLYLKQSNTALYSNTIATNIADNTHCPPACGGGGGVYLDNSPADLFRNYILNNVVRSGGHGGGLFLNNSGATIESNNIISNTAVGSGGGLFSDSSLIMTDTDFISNTAQTDGGGARILGKVTISNSRFERNISLVGEGGGLGSSSSVTATNSLFIHNSGDVGGGLGTAATLTLSNTDLVSNTGIFGGGAAVGGLVAISGSRFLCNTVTDGLGAGLIIRDDTGDAGRIERSVFAHNRAEGAPGSGGGIYFESIPGGSSLTLINSTVSHNNAATSGGGLMLGSLLGGSGGTLVLTHTTVASNTAIGSGGGINQDTGTVALASTIVANNTGGNCAGTISSNGYNLDSGTSCGFSASGDITGTDPLLGLLRDNGGDTLTHALLPGSPAIDAGKSDCPPPTTDQRGVSRPVGPACDIGAFETSIPVLSISKTGSATATAGALITYTLTVTNNGPGEAVNLVITDAIPAGAYYISGGNRVGEVVSWTVPSLAASDGVTQATFVVTATGAVTNRLYGVRADGGYRAEGSVEVVTQVEVEEQKLYLPVILKE